MIERFGEPSKMDTAPKGTLCKVCNHNSIDTVEFFLQINSNEEDPNWISLGCFNKDDEDKLINFHKILKNLK